MKRRWLAALLLCCSATAHADSGGSALWRTPDQRGDAALRAGDAAAAARWYANPRRKAYAQLQAGDYRGAAQSYAAFDDADAHYNRGNALARAGDLQQALQAYDAALARNPNDVDARHNRALVAEALRPPPSGGAPGRQPSPQPGGTARPPPSQAAASGLPGSRPAERPPDRQDAAGAGRGPASPGADNPAAGANARAPAAGTGPAAGSTGSTARSTTNAGNAAPEPAHADDAAQAQRDLLGGTGRPAARRDPQTAQREPRSEQQLSEEQWLRRLPDDPGGLLRRKFLIQQLIRQGTPP